MANGDKMARSEAAKKADQRYKAEKTKQLVVRFYPADADVLEHLQAQESKQGYIKRLIREDMGRTNGERLMRDRPEVLAGFMAEHHEACGCCAFEGTCGEGQENAGRKCAEGVLEWLGGRDGQE